MACWVLRLRESWVGHQCDKSGRGGETRSHTEVVDELMIPHTKITLRLKGCKREGPQREIHPPTLLRMAPAHYPWKNRASWQAQSSSEMREQRVNRGWHQASKTRSIGLLSEFASSKPHARGSITLDPALANSGRPSRGNWASQSKARGEAIPPPTKRSPARMVIAG